MGGMTDSTSRVVSTEKLNFMMLLVWLKSVECHKITRAESAVLPKFAGEFRTHWHWPVSSCDIKEVESREIQRHSHENLMLMLPPK